MAKYNRIEVYLKMKETGLVPIFYNPDVEICKKVIKACYEGEEGCLNSLIAGNLRMKLSMN